MKYLLVNEAQTPGFFIARVNACFSLPFLFRIKTNYNDCCKIVVKTFGSNTTNVVSLVYTKTAIEIINHEKTKLLERR